MKNLTNLQKRRLASAMNAALAARQTYYVAWITDAPEAKLEEFARILSDADDAFVLLVNARGFCRGDLVYVTGNPAGAVQMQIEDIDWNGATVKLSAPDGAELVAQPAELTVAEIRSDRERKRKRERENRP